MTFYHHIDPLEQRALAMPQMKNMLASLAAKHASLEKTVTNDALWKSIGSPVGNPNDKTPGKDAHFAAAREAGFFEETPSHGNNHMRVRLTDKGYQAIGQKRPFWEGAA